MKKLLVLSALSIFFIPNCYSQNKGYVAINLGPSFPVGDFASKDGNNESSGFADSGLAFDVTFAYKLTKNYGISALLRGQSNNLNEGAFAREFANYGYWHVDSEPWTIGSLMVGGYGSFPVSSTISFETKAMLGYVNVTSPEIYVTPYASNGSYWAHQSSETATAFSYLISGGFKFDVGKKICLLTSLDYLGAKPKFKNVEVTTSSGEFYSDDLEQKIGTITFSVGIGLRL